MKKIILWATALIWSFANLWHPTPSQAQALFQNDDRSCEEHDIIAAVVMAGEGDESSFTFDSAVTCGRFNDDSTVLDPTHGGNPDFPDCASQADEVATMSFMQPTNSILINTAAHGDNCVNAGGSNPQFFDPDILTLMELDAQRRGSIAHGNLDGGNFDDVAMVEAGFPNDSSSSRALGFLLSQPGGGFGNPTVLSGEALLEPNPATAVPYQTFPASLLLSATFGDINDALVAQSSLVLLDCDNDGVDEGAVTVKNANDSTDLGLMVVPNDGSGLVDNPIPTFFQLPAPAGALSDDALAMPLVQGDFTGDGIPDLLATISDTTQNSGLAVLCPGDGTCGFNCPSSPDPNVLSLPGPLVFFSAASGDFDGDGLPDGVIAELTSLMGGTGQLRYLLNRGATLDSWQQEVINLTLPSGDTHAAFVLTSGRFTTLAVQNEIDEVATNSATLVGGVMGTSNVTVVPSDGAGSFGTPRILNYDFPATFPPFLPVAGIDAEDFDHCGGDDILSLLQSVETSGAGSPVVGALASLFLNENEAPVAAADIDPGIGRNVAAPLSGSCTDPTNDQQSFQWSVLSAPAGAGVVFGTPSGTLMPGQTDASTTVTVDTVGEYEFQLSCRDFCDLAATAVVETRLVLTQGANLFNCSLGQQVSGGAVPSFWFLFVLGPGLLTLFRWSRRSRG